MSLADSTPENTRAALEVRVLRMLRSGDSRKDIAQATGLSIPEIDKLAVDFPGPHQARPIALAAPEPSPIKGLLEHAAEHSSKRVQALATRIGTQLFDLETLISSLADDERRKVAEAAAKQKARNEVVRLEAELARAKALLRGKPAPAGKPTTVAAASGPKTCRDCGTEIVRAPGQQGALPRRCASCKAAQA